MQVELSEHKIAGKVFHFCEFGRGSDGKPSFRLWVAPELVTPAEKRPCPDQDRRIRCTQTHCTQCGARLIGDGRSTNWYHPRTGNITLPASLTLPIKATIIHTAKGGLLLDDHPSHWVFCHAIPAGVRGSASIQTIDPVPAERLDYSVFYPRTNELTTGAIIETARFPVTITWRQSGHVWQRPAAMCKRAYYCSPSPGLDQPGTGAG